MTSTCALVFVLLMANGVAAAELDKATSAPLVFSALKPGQALPKEFRVITIPKIASNQFSLEQADGNTVLRVDSSNGAGSVNIPLPALAGSSRTTLAWRWKVSRVLASADMATRAGDDFAARVYVFFDVPLASLPFVERSKIRLAQLLAGAEVPTAALCYVWDNRQRVGHTQWSPYTNRVRKIVLQSGPANAGNWTSESRDLNADFRDAFGIDAPAVIGVAVGNDTDNTHERVTTWFGDVVLAAR